MPSNTVPAYTVPAYTIPELLAARAADEPGRTAILMPDGRRLTFQDWQERANASARSLVARGVRRGDRIGLVFGGEDWIDYAVAYVATHLAGGVAVPVSTKLAGAEVRELLAHCAAVGLISAAAVPGISGWQHRIATLDSGDPTPPEIPLSPADTAQIVYTSGTTGRPNGVTATHANLTHGYEPRPRQRRFAHSEVFLHAFPIGTNGGQNMLLYALAAHPTALPLPSFDSDTFAAVIEAHRVGTVFVVPSMAIDLLNSRAYERHDLSSVLLFSSSAAALPPAVARSLADALPDATIVNFYSSTESGPAETTMVVDPARPGSGGRPANPGDIRVADELGNALPSGQVGDVWLRSPAPVRSYHGDPGASAATFRDGWVRMGDVGYLDDEGYLFLVDRERDVINSGGLKISTLQVEAALYEHPAVAEAAVLAIPHPVMGSAVAAAVVTRSAVSVPDLRDFLKPRLGRHQIPTRLMLVESLPHNEIGKVIKRDVRELFAESRPRRSTVPLRTPSEVSLGLLWTGILDVATVGADDDFFALGGDSLKATQLATAVSELFGIDAGVALVFDTPVLARQAERIDTLRTGSRAPIGADRVGTDGVPLGATQEYFLQWMHATPVRRQIQPMSVALRIRDDLDLGALERGLNELVARHEMLRATFARTGTGFRVEIRPEVAIRLSTVDAQGERAALALACQEIERPWDLERGPLLRALVVTLGPADRVLVLIAEHLVFDGMSFAVLLRELGLAYSAQRLGKPSPLGPLPLTASEFFALTRRQWTANRDFWRERLAGAPPALPHLPGHDAGAVRYVGRSVEFEVPAEAAQGLRDTARAQRATTFMVALATWCAVLRDWTGAGDIVVQTPVTGRNQPEYESLVGCVVQLLMIRIPLDGADTFTELLGRVRARVIEAADRQVHRFAEVAALVPYPVHFFFESWGGPAHLPGLESQPFALPPELCLNWPFAEGDPDLSAPRLSLVELPDGTIAGRLLYNAEAYQPATVERLARLFLTSIEQRRRP